MEKRFGEYADRGDYHVDLPQDWPYLPVYLEKMVIARKFLDACKPDEVVYDMGCGEGVLVNEYRRAGLNITGIDLNYSSEFVVKRSFIESGLPDSSVDVLTCLDVIEHLNFADQEKAFAEFARVLKPGGRALVTLPNLAHFASRLSFLVTGKLIRTSSSDRHPGDRPAGEYMKMIKKYFRITSRKGVFPTFPVISLLTVKIPSRVLWMHRIYNRILAWPNWCFLNAFEFTKPQSK